MEHSVSYLGELNSMFYIANEQKLESGQLSLSFSLSLSVKLTL